MAIDRLFNELNSRSFIITINGNTFELPHLASKNMKSAINKLYLFKDGETINTLTAELFIFDAVNNPKLSEEVRELSFNEMDELFTAWGEWCDFSLGKVVAVLDIVDRFQGGVELDLLERYKISFKEFFELPTRTQVNIIETLLRELDSHTFTEANEYSYRWSHEREILSRGIEYFLQVNSKKGSKPPEMARPFKKGANKQSEITAEEQERIFNMLTPIPGLSDYEGGDTNG